MEGAFTDAQGTCLLSGRAVSELTNVLWTEYEAFQRRPLADVPVCAVFLDGVYEPLRAHGVEREAVLAAWAITRDGHKVLLALALGNRESHEAWRELLRELAARRACTPLTLTPGAARVCIRP